MIVTRQASRREKDRSWIYIASFIIVAAFAYDVERHIEMNQMPLAVDYD